MSSSIVISRLSSTHAKVYIDLFLLFSCCGCFPESHGSQPRAHSPQPRFLTGVPSYILMVVPRPWPLFAPSYVYRTLGFVASLLEGVSILGRIMWSAVRPGSREPPKKRDRGGILEDPSRPPTRHFSLNAPYAGPYFERSETGACVPGLVNMLQHVASRSKHILTLLARPTHTSSEAKPGVWGGPPGKEAVWNGNAVKTIDLVIATQPVYT